MKGKSAKSFKGIALLVKKNGWASLLNSDSTFLEYLIVH